MCFDFIVPPLPQPIVLPEQPTAPERESIMGHGVPHNLGTEGMKSCLRRRRTVSSSKVEGIVTAELRARKLQPDRPIHYPTDSLLSWNNQVGPEERIDISQVPTLRRGWTRGVWSTGRGCSSACVARDLRLRTFSRMGSGERRLKKRALLKSLISRVSAANWVAFLLGDPR